MSSYEMQRYMYDWLKSRDGRNITKFDPSTYELDREEKRALEDVDIATLFERGAHPVLIQQYGRGNGKTTADLRTELGKVGVPERKPARWRN